MKLFLQAAAGLAAAVLAFSPAVPASKAPAAEPLLVGYYTGWSAYSGYTPDKVPADKLTHLHYAFAEIGADNRIALTDQTQDLKNFEGLRALKKANPALKTLISVGGWDGSARFSDAAATEKSRAVFAESCVDFIVKHGFDGVDLDWEYPVSGGKAGNKERPQDKENLTLLLKTLREKLGEQGERDGRPYLLTMAAGVSGEYLKKIQPQKVAEYTNYIFLMAYDLHGPWDRYADLNAPLYQPSEASPQYKLSVKGGVENWLAAGVAAEKLVLGMPFYGYVYEGASGLYDTYRSAKSVSYDQVKRGYIGKGKQARHPDGKVPYLVGRDFLLSYEDPASAAEKAELAKEQKLAGVGAWALAHDREGELLGSIYAVLKPDDSR